MLTEVVAMVAMQIQTVTSSPARSSWASTCSLHFISFPPCFNPCASSSPHAPPADLLRVPAICHIGRRLSPDFHKKNQKKTRQLIGKMNRHRRQGHGTYIHQVGGRFEGGWMNDTMVRHFSPIIEMGWGEMSIRCSWRCRGTDSFGWLQHGHGKFVFQSGTIYEGAWFNNNQHGTGRAPLSPTHQSSVLLEPSLLVFPPPSNALCRPLSFANSLMVQLLPPRSRSPVVLPPLLSRQGS